MKNYKFTVTPKGKKFAHEVKDSNGVIVKKRNSTREYQFVTISQHIEFPESNLQFTFGDKPEGTKYHSTYKIISVMSPINWI